MKDKIILHGKTFVPYIKHEDIIERIDEIAQKINEDFADYDDVPLIICVLNGSIIFTGVLIQRFDFDCELVSVKLSSYQGTKSTGTVLNVIGLTADIKDRRIIICEDIVDTGNTIVALKEMLIHKGAKEVKICTLFNKPEVYDKDEVLDYVGFAIPNKFVIGFGLDYNELGRNHRDLYALDE